MGLDTRTLSLHVSRLFASSYIFEQEEDQQMQLALGYRPNRMPIECFGVSHEINERSGPFGWLHLLHCRSGRFHLAFCVIVAVGSREISELDMRRRR